MKRRIVKKALRRTERGIAETLSAFIKSSDCSEKILIDYENCYLGIDFAYLLMNYLILYYPQWPHNQRWIDDVEWDLLSMDQIKKEIKGMGTLWWGNRCSIAGQMTNVVIEINLQLLKLGNRPRISYKLEFKSDGNLYRVKKL